MIHRSTQQKKQIDFLFFFNPSDLIHFFFYVSLSLYLSISKICVSCRCCFVFFLLCLLVNQRTNALKQKKNNKTMDGIFFLRVVFLFPELYLSLSLFLIMLRVFLRKESGAGYGADLSLEIAEIEKKN